MPSFTRRAPPANAGAAAHAATTASAASARIQRELLLSPLYFQDDAVVLRSSISVTTCTITGLNDCIGGYPCQSCETSLGCLRGRLAGLSASVQVGRLDLPEPKSRTVLGRGCSLQPPPVSHSRHGHTIRSDKGEETLSARNTDHDSLRHSFPTKPHTGAPLTTAKPTGIGSLDELLSGGLVGSTLLLHSDPHTQWGRLVARHVLSKGLLARESVVLIADDYADWVRNLPWVEESSLQQPGKKTGDESESEGELDSNERQGDSRIAWRYDNLPKFKTTSGQTSLSTAISMPAETLRGYEQAGALKYLDPGQFVGKGVEGLLKKVEEMAPARLVLELGDWSLGLTGDEIRRLLLGLKALSRGRVSLTVMPTTPPMSTASTSSGYSSYAPDTSSESSWLASLPGLTDCTLLLEGFGTDPTLLQAYHPLHGFLRPILLPSVGSLLAPSYRKSELLGLQAGENNLGFRLKRKRFVVETVHLGIEGGSNERRTGPVEKRVVATEEIGPSSDIPAGEGPVEISGGIDMPRSKVITEGEGEGAGAVKSALAGGAAKPKKNKVSVRFGGADDEPPVKHNHAPRVEIRHDKPELYEF